MTIIDRRSNGTYAYRPRPSHLRLAIFGSSKWPVWRGSERDISGPPSRQKANKRRPAGLLYYAHGPSMARLLHAARAIFGSSGICKWEGLYRQHVMRCKSDCVVFNELWSNMSSLPSRSTLRSMSNGCLVDLCMGEATEATALSNSAYMKMVSPADAHRSCVATPFDHLDQFLDAVINARWPLETIVATGAWWLIGRVDACWPEGCGFKSRSSRHVIKGQWTLDLGQVLYLQLPVALRAVSGTPLSSSGLEEALLEYCRMNEWIDVNWSVMQSLQCYTMNYTM